MSADIDIRPAQASDLAVATAWLSTAGLPTDDLTADHMEAFIVATRSDEPVGMIGIEKFGAVGLLRSLFVDNTCRSAGLGARLVAALESAAYQDGVTELWLLTIDADPFFARHGYNVAERDDAPDAIQSTPEFSDLCPGDAVLMRKHIC